MNFLSSLISQSITGLDNALGNLITYPLAQLLGLSVIFKVPSGPVCEELPLPATSHAATSRICSPFESVSWSVK